MNVQVPDLAGAAPAEKEGHGQSWTPRGRLFRKFVLLFVALIGGALLASGALELWFSYQENKAALARVQQEKAIAAAGRIENFIDEISRQIGWTTRALRSRPDVEQRRLEYLRLLTQAPAITEISHLDAEGRETLRVSRLAVDVVGGGTDFSAEPKFKEAQPGQPWFSPVYFRRESEPYVTVAVAGSGRSGGVTVAEVNLKFIWDVISAIRLGQGGYAYVVDSGGWLIAHPDIGLGFGIGVAHGFATLGRIGFEGRNDYSAIGTVVDLAARLCGEARDGQILVEVKVRAAIEDVADVEPVGELMLKGFLRPVAAFNVLKLLAAAPH